MRPTGFRLTLALALALPSAAQAQGTLGRPTGPYRIGTTRIVAVDSSRSGVPAAGTSEPRRLIVQVWYPAQPTGRERRAPYVLELDRVAADLAEAMPGVAFGEVRTAAMLDAPPLKTRFPLVVFSHGMNSARYFYTTLLQDLASHGFVVAAIDHPFWTLTTAFDAGHNIPMAESMAARDQLTSEQIDGYMEDGVGLMAEDQAFVADRFPALVPRLGPAVHGRRWPAHGSACLPRAPASTGWSGGGRGSLRSASLRTRYPDPSSCSPLRSSCRPTSRPRWPDTGAHGTTPSSAW
jgi:hypothetical protein